MSDGGCIVRENRFKEHAIKRIFALLLKCDEGCDTKTIWHYSNFRRYIWLARYISVSSKVTSNILRRNPVRELVLRTGHIQFSLSSDLKSMAEAIVAAD
jgi:hypothetical protein